MSSTTLLKLLSTFDKEEWKRFEKFVKSPYFNSNKALIHLLRILKKHHPHFDSPKLQKTKVFQQLFPTRAYKEKRIWQLMSDLKGLAEQFLVAEKNNTNSIDYQLQLKASFLDRGLYDWFEQKSKKLQERLTTTDVWERSNQYFLHQLNDHWYFNTESVNPQPNAPTLVAANHHLEIYFHLQQLKYACEWASRNLQINEKMPPFTEAITYQTQFDKQVVYQLYYHLFLQLTAAKQTNEASFKKLFLQLKKHIGDLPRKDQFILVSLFINYSIRQYQLNQAHYAQTVFDLHKLGLDTKCLIDKGLLTEITFMNVVGIATILKEFDWLANFCKQYQSYLKPETIEANLCWAKAMIHFYKGQYKEAVSTFSAFHFDKAKRELPRRSVQIRACLECFMLDASYYELLQSKSYSFEKYLNRKEGIGKVKKNVYYNLNRAVRNLARLIKENQPITKFELLETWVLAEVEIGAKDWLLKHLRAAKVIRKEQLSNQRLK